MKNLLILLLCLFSAIAAGQTQTENYIKRVIYKQPTTSSIATPAVNIANTQVTYIDGLGRPKQYISFQQSPSGKSIVVPVEYDSYGRISKKYLPYRSANGNLDIELNSVLSFFSNPTPATTGNPNFESTGNPFSQNEFEASPLNRVIESASPGNDWAIANDHTIKVEYKINTSVDQVKLFKAVSTWNTTNKTYETSFLNGQIASYYNPNQLKKTVRYDQNSGSNPAETTGSFIEFKNALDQIVLKRFYDSGIKYDTYYVYDQYANLAYVVPPKAENLIDQTVLDNLCFQYRYDAKNRLVEKKLPGKQWEYIVYDKRNRPVLIGPASSPFKENTTMGWKVTKYDVLNRPVYTGWYSGHQVSSNDRNSIQTIENNATAVDEAKGSQITIDNIPIAYTNSAFPTSSFYILSINYYDNYSFPNSTGVPTAVEGQTINNTPRNLLTGTWARVLTSETEFNGETVNIFYDNKARIVRIYEKNYLGGYTQTDEKLNFLGIKSKSVTTHKRLAADTELKLTDNYTYSDQGRLTKHTHQINNLPEQLLSENTYDELGQLITKDVGNTSGSPLQKVNYSYNTNGWLTGINNISNLSMPGEPVDLFAFKMNYNTVENCTNYTGTPLYNGNVSETYWRTSVDNVRRKYGYKYDRLNRFREAIYQRPDETIQVTNSYNESVTYDKNGNILSLQRNGDFDSQVQTILIDDLTYTYKDNGISNRLAKVADVSGANSTLGFKDGTNAGDDFEYDDNGNLITDNNKGITLIKYNYLNLPLEITMGATKKIQFIYDACGEKVKKIVTQGSTVTTTDYLQGFQYKTTGSTTALQFFPTAEGYVNFNSDVYKYVFNYTDNLGNIRMSYVADAASPNGLAILEQNHYYPFGLKHTNYNTTILKLRGGQIEAAQNAIYKYKFEGQELQDELGLNWYAFKWRNYDPTIGRFMSSDPLAEEYNWMTNYQFSSNQVVHAPEIEGLESYDDLNNWDLDFDEYQVFGIDLFDGDTQIHLPEFELEGVTIVNNTGGGSGDFEDYLEDFAEDIEEWWHDTEMYFEIELGASIGAQAEQKLNDFGRDIDLSMNFFSFELGKFTLSQKGHDYNPWEVEASLIGNKDPFHVEQEFEIPLIAGYEHSFDTHGTGFVDGTDKDEFHLGPVSTDFEEEALLEFGWSGALFLGLDVHVEIGRK